MLALLAALAIAPLDGARVVGEVEGVRVVGRVESRAPVEPGDVDALAPDVAWASAPAVGVRARLALDGAGLRVVARAGGEPLIVVGPRGVVIAVALDDPSNRALLRWGYWPYVMHAAARHAEG